MTKHTHKGGFPLLQLALGAALAAGAGYYVTHKEKVDREAKKKIDKLAKMFRENRPMVEKRVKMVWGEVSKEAIATYVDLRGRLLHELEEENLKKQGKMLKSQYEKIVNDVVRQAKKSGVLTPDVEKKLTQLFNMDWNDVSKLLMKLLSSTAKKSAKKVKRAVKKTAKRVGKKVAKKMAGKKRR
jgi:gas vesicle protein